MKNTRKCTKCGHDDILIVEGRTRANGAGNVIHTGLTNLGAVKVYRYVCTSCGFSEEWILKEDIPKLVKTFRG